MSAPPRFLSDDEWKRVHVAQRAQIAEIEKFGYGERSAYICGLEVGVTLALRNPDLARRIVEQLLSVNADWDGTDSSGLHEELAKRVAAYEAGA